MVQRKPLLRKSKTDKEDMETKNKEDERRKDMAERIQNQRIKEHMKGIRLLPLEVGTEVPAHQNHNGGSNQ